MRLQIEPLTRLDIDVSRARGSDVLGGQSVTAPRGRWWTPRWTIGHALALLVLAALVPFAALGAYWAVADYHSEQARTQARALQLAHEVGAEVDQFVADTAALVEAMARVPSVKRSEQPETNQLLGELVGRYPFYESLFVADADGRVLASGGEDVPPPGNRLTYIRDVLQRGATVVTDPITPRNSSRHVFVVATPLWDETGKPLGVVAASVNLLRLQEGMRRAELPENSSVLIVDQQGRIVARRTAPEQWVGRSALDSSAVRDALARREGASEGDFVDGVRRLSGFAAAQRVPWEIIVGIPTSEAYGALQRELLRSVARVMLAALLTGLLTWLMGRRLTRSIVDLAAAAHAFAAGDLSHRVRPGGPVEVAELGATFNAMAAALEQQVVELQSAQQREREAGERALAELRRLHSEFIAVAAHELRTPVAGAKSYAELLLRDGDDVALPPATRRQALLRLDAVCERLARLVRALLGASRIQAGRLEVAHVPVDVAALIRRVVDDFSGYTPSHDVQVVLPTVHRAASRAQPTPELLALADPERIEDVLVNLLTNAAKYSPDGTIITVRAQRVLSVGAAHEGIKVQVADQGPGIPPEEHVLVFERFRRGSGVGGQAGIGLGLYIAQAYVQAMGGDIGVHSTPGRGATFWFRLDAASARNLPTPPARMPDAPVEQVPAPAPDEAMVEAAG